MMVQLLSTVIADITVQLAPLDLIMKSVLSGSSTLLVQQVAHALRAQLEVIVTKLFKFPANQDSSAISQVLHPQKAFTSRVQLVRLQQALAL